MLFAFFCDHVFFCKRKKTFDLVGPFGLYFSIGNAEIKWGEACERR